MSFSRESNTFSSHPSSRRQNIYTETKLTLEWYLGLVRFVPKGDDSKVLIGEPIDSQVDVGAAVRKGEDVEVNVYSGTSVLDAGSPTGNKAIIGRILSPVTAQEAGTIRCIGLNVSFCPLTRAPKPPLRLLRCRQYNSPTWLHN